MTLGYTLAGLLAFRLGYGLIGPRQARLSLLWRKLAGLPAWLRSLQPGNGRRRELAPGTEPADGAGGRRADGGGPAGGLSGYATYNDWGGEWLAELHEFTGELFLWLVLGHLALILGLSLLRRKNQALPMLTGRVAGRGAGPRANTTMAHWPRCCWPPCWASGPGNGSRRPLDR